LPLHYGKTGNKINKTQRENVFSKIYLEDFMKRIGVVLLVLVIAGGLYAQDGPPPRDWSVTIGGFGRGAFAPIQYVGESKDSAGNKTDAQTYAGIGASWGFQYLNLGLTVNAGSEAIGVHADVQLDKTGIALGNDGYAYVKPFSFVSLKLGKFADATLGGKISNTDFHMFVLPEKNEDALFTRFLSGENTLGNVNYATTFAGARDAHVKAEFDDASDPKEINVDAAIRGEGEVGQKGFLLLLTPLKGLTVGLNLPSMGQAVYSAYTATMGAQWGDPQSVAKYVWGNAQAAIGYEVEGIGHIRAQYVGVKDGIINGDGKWELNDYVYYEPNSRIEAAFAYTGVQGLTLDLGFKYYLPSDQSTRSYNGVWSDYAKGMALGLGARYSGGGYGGFGPGSFTIEGRIDGAFGGKYKITPYGPPGSSSQDAENGVNLNAHLSPSYNLGICTVGGDFGFELQGDSKRDGTENKDGYTRFGVGAWVQKDLGIAKYIKAGVGATLPYTDNTDKEHGVVISVPIIFQYVFF
jgi:hypothetical protein